MEIEYYTPKIINDTYATFLLQINHCTICGNKMIEKPENTKIFPNWFKINFDAQIERAGIRLQSKLRVNDRYICSDCAMISASEFLCAACQEEKPPAKIKYSFGFPPEAEYLCKDCYKIVPAARWDFLKRKLINKYGH